METQVIFRILVTDPGVSLEGRGSLECAPKTDSALALACLASKIDQEVHSNVVAELILPVNANQSVTELLKQKHNRDRVSAAVGWLRKVLPGGEERVPRRLVHGEVLYYKLNGSRDEVDAWVLIEDRAHAERAMKSEDYTTAITAAKHGLSLWAGPLLHKFFTKTAAGGNLRDQLTAAEEDLFDLFTEAAMGMGLDLSWAERYLSSNLMEHPEFRLSITYNLIRLNQARSDIPEARRLLEGLDGQELPEKWTKRIQSLTASAADNRAEISIRQDSLTRSMPAEIQSRIIQLDPSNRAQVTLMELLATTQVHADFRMFIVSGVSAAGKDTLIASARDDATIAQRFEILTKYTTRPSRTNEASYSRAVSWDEFLRLVETGHMAFLYEKRQQLYGFDVQQLKRAMIQGIKLVAIFTEFDQVPEAQRLLNSYGAVVVPILVSADFPTAVRRTHLRNFSVQEQQERIESIMEDLVRMNTRAIHQEYVVIPHTNDHGFNSALVKLRQILDGTDPEVVASTQR
jgi:ribose 1,5-bisphosphokinase PhnN